MRRTAVRKNRQDERGAVLAIAAVSMAMLLVFAAFAIDLGTVYLHRQDDQTAADLAVIAAAADRFEDVQAATTAADTLNANLGTSFTVADMNTCPSITMPSGWVTYTNYNCLARDASWTKMLLQVPPQSTPTGFARLAGVNAIDHSAFAVVAVLSPNKGGVLPVIAHANAGAYQCLKVGASNVPDDQCSDNNSGNFGLANFGQFGNQELGTVNDCGGDGKSRMADHLAMGLDHDVSRYLFRPHNTNVVIDTVSCGTQPAPNAVETLTGNVPNWVAAGMIDQATFSDGRPARLRRVGGMSWFDETVIDSKPVDDTPLWEFIDTNLSSANVPRSCWSDQFVGDGGGLNPDNDAEMSDIGIPSDPVVVHLLNIPVEDRMIKLIERCFAHYRGDLWTDNGAYNPGEPAAGCTGPCDDPIFKKNTEREFPDFYDIQLSPRFAYVPVTNADPSTWSGGTALTIDSISPIYLQRIYGGNCDTNGCDISFDPGHGYTSTVATDKISAFTAFLFPRGTLPDGLDLPSAPVEIGSHRYVRLIR